MTEAASHSQESSEQDQVMLSRVVDGEHITISGHVVAELKPVVERQRWMPRERFIREVLACQADAALADDLASLGDQETDDLRWP